MSTLFEIVAIICTIVVWIIYHSVFDVHYFSSGGCFTEILFCIIGGVLLAALILGVLVKYWWILLIIIAIVIVGIIVVKNR